MPFIPNSFNIAKAKRALIPNQEEIRKHSQSYQALFVDGFTGQSDEVVGVWWDRVQDQPAPRGRLNWEYNASRTDGIPHD